MKIRHSILRRRLSERQPVWCFKSNIASPMVSELIGGRGVECIWLDMEHFPMSIETTSHLIQACRGTDTDSIVRIPNGEFGLAARMLDNGADAIMYPQCGSADEIRALISAVRYPPSGQRGIDTGPYQAGYASLSITEIIESKAHRDVMMIQIETPDAVECIDQIAAVPGVDGLFFGPADLSVHLGVPCDPHHERIAPIIERVAAVAREHDIAWGMPAFGIDHFRELLGMGALFIAFGSDSTTLGNQLDLMREQVAPLLGRE